MKITFDCQLVRYGFLLGAAYGSYAYGEHTVHLALGPVSVSITVSAA